MSADVERLALKLLETLHLSVPERKQLPGGAVPLSALVAAVTSRLQETGWFPEPLGDDADLWTGARIELRGSELWLHERHEAGAMRVGPIRSRPVPSVAEAVRALIDANGGAPVDGVRVDWGA
jgi:hypothetical protein